jgi:multicomponent K+:H+ antiporter subunit E
MGPANHVRWLPAMRLAAVVLWDIVVSNFTVARLVLGPMSRPRPGWVLVALDSEHPMVNSLFATIITTTPGTVSCTLDETRRHIWVHALDCDNAEAMARDMKARYEAPLMHIFSALSTVRPQELAP